VWMWVWVWVWVCIRAFGWRRISPQQLRDVALRMCMLVLACEGVGDVYVFLHVCVVGRDK